MRGRAYGMARSLCDSAIINARCNTTRTLIAPGIGATKGIKHAQRARCRCKHAPPAAHAAGAIALATYLRAVGAAPRRARVLCACCMALTATAAVTLFSA